MPDHRRAPLADQRKRPHRVAEIAGDPQPVLDQAAAPLILAALLKGKCACSLASTVRVGVPLRHRRALGRGFGCEFLLAAGVAYFFFGVNDWFGNADAAGRCITMKLRFAA